jgi:C4-dicarboxylate-binding protein DctP
MKTLGAAASVSPLTSVYDALKRGQLDGQENTPINIDTQRLHEVQSHLTISNHGYLAYAVLVNKVFWEKLPADLRSTLEAALREATAHEYALALTENEKALARITASPHLTVHTLSPAELQQWRAASQPVYQAARASISPDTLAALKILDAAPP